MNKIENPVLKPHEATSPYLKCYSLEYTQNNIPKNFGCGYKGDVVVIIIYNVTRKVLIFVKQFRAPVYACAVLEQGSDRLDGAKYPGDVGLTIEFCAGRVDKQLSLEQIAKEEVLEECGYDVPVDSLEYVQSYIHETGQRITMYYCEVTDSMKVSNGGGVDEEVIDVVEMSVEEAQKRLSQDGIVISDDVFFGMYWFLLHKGG